MTCWRPSAPEEFKDTSRSLAVDWTDLEFFSRPPPAQGGDCADPEASWGHRKNNLLRSEDELFYGYYLSAGHDPDETGRRPRARPPRRAIVVPARPVPGLRPRADRVPGQGSRSATSWPTAATPTVTPEPGPPAAGRRARSSRTSIPMTAARKAPRRRGHRQRQPVLPPDTAPAAGARPAGPRRHEEQAADRERKAGELARYKLGRLTTDDAGGYHRVQ